MPWRWRRPQDEEGRGDALCSNGKTERANSISAGPLHFNVVACRRRPRVSYDLESMNGIVVSLATIFQLLQLGQQTWTKDLIQLLGPKSNETGEKFLG